MSSSARPQKWIIPGGKVKPEEEPETSAAREALEEAGVVGKLGRFLGIFENKERRHRTRVYILTVEQLLEQYDVSNSLWSFSVLHANVGQPTFVHILSDIHILSYISPSSDLLSCYCLLSCF